MRELIRRRLPSIIVGLVILVLLFAVRIAGFATDLWWFDSIGYRSVFTGILGTQVMVGLVFGLAVTIAVAVNLVIARRLRPFFIPSTPEQVTIERYRQMADPYLPWLIGAISLMFGTGIGLGMASQWEPFLLWRNAQSFGIADPQFGQDVGFYIFTLPWLDLVQSWLMSTLVIVTMLAAGAHYLLGGIRPEAQGDKVMPNVKVHLSVLLALILMVQGWGFWLDRYFLNFSPRGQVTGASYTDVNAELPALTMLLIVTVIAVGLTLFNIRRRGFLLPGAAIGLILLANILLSGVYPSLIQRLRVVPQELQQETEYIGRNLEFTLAAYGMKDVESRTYEAGETLQLSDLRDEAPTFENIRLWDKETLATTYEELQAQRPYYGFNDVDVDRYVIDGVERQVMLSVRELKQSGLSGQARNWQNERLTYTHGQGIVASQVNTANNQGQPVFLVDDIPSSGVEVMTPDLPRSAIYFGEVAPVGAGNPDYSIVNTDQPELSFEDPDTLEQQFTSYAGKGGVEMSGLGSRLAFALRFSDPNLVLSPLLTDESRILFNRDIGERIRKVAPYLELDRDPYPVVIEDRVLWVQDAYTVSNFYPYSQQTSTVVGSLNYVRNSVKAIVDAYDGSVRLFAADDEDPILAAWRQAFPEPYIDEADLPTGIEEHFRYPQSLFSIQRSIYRTYHIPTVNGFFNKGDEWDLPIDAAATQNGLAGRRTLDPYYLLMRLPGEDAPEFVLVQPYLARDKPNMVAWLAARSDPEHYGELLSLNFRSSPIGIEQAQTRLEQDDRISEYITVRSNEGSKVVRGNMIVLPVNNAIVYIEPLFLDLEGTGSLPELAKVVAISGGSVGFADTLDDALLDLVNAPNSDRPDQPDDPEATAEQLLQQAFEAFRAADAALAMGDLGSYQSQVERGRELVRRAAEAQGITVVDPEPEPEPEATPTGEATPSEDETPA